jgi:hypothetical protein
MTDKLRQQIALEAARLVNEGCDMATARLRAARARHRGWVPDGDLPSEQEIQQALTPTAHHAGDRFLRIAETVRLLATIRSHHASGASADALEHTLQVFAALYEEQPYDEELLTAALVLHAGLVIDRSDPLRAVIRVLGDSLTPRTIWFLETFPTAQVHVAGTIGQRARRRLEAHPDSEQVVLLAEIDRKVAAAPRQPVQDLLDLDEAITILQSLDAEDTDAWEERP